MILYSTFPRTWTPPEWVGLTVEIFRHHESTISALRQQGPLSSEEVLAVLARDLERLGFCIEKMNLADLPGHSHPSPADQAETDHYRFDVYHPQWHCCVAIEDGPAWANDAIDEDAVEPLLVANADTLCLAVPGSAAHGQESEYDRAVALAQAVYHRSRSYLPHRLVLIGY